MATSFAYDVMSVSCELSWRCVMGISVERSLMADFERSAFEISIPADLDAL